MIEAEASYEAERCSFCGSIGAAPIEDLVEVLETAVRRYFRTALDAGVPWDQEEGRWMFPVLDSEDALMSLDPALDDEVHQAVVDILYEDDEAWVGRHDPADSPEERLWRGWDEFSSHVQHRSRFQLAPDEVSTVYEPVPPYSRSETLRAIGNLIIGLELVEELPVGTALFRARTFDDALPFDNTRQMVAPPRSKASQGRMNAAGISFLYAALDRDTAAAEVYDGKAHVAICELRPLRSLVIIDLDLYRLRELSPFDPDVGTSEFEYTAFLRRFVREITRPIARDDRVHYEYAPTQFFTEFLRWQLGDDIRPDGIVYPSARAEGRNVVIFVGQAGCLTDQQLSHADSERDEPQVLNLLGPTVEIRDYCPPPTRNARTRSLKT
jgi:hypothetical protein